MAAVVTNQTQGGAVAAEDPGHPGLSPDERAEAVTIAARLAEELRMLVATFPAPARRVRGMAEFLRIDRNTCQRVLAATKVGNEVLTVLLRAPGVEALRAVVSGSRARGCSPEAVAAAGAAVAQFAALVSRLGGSHARVRARVERALLGHEGGALGSAPAQVAVRRRMFSGACELAGKRVALQLSVAVVRPLPEDGARIERAGVTGFIGQQTRPGAMPLAVTFAHSSDRPEAADPSIRYTGLEAAAAETLVDQFSTSPLPVVTTRGPLGRVVHVIDPALSGGRDKFDVVLGHRMSPVSHPAQHETPVLNLVSRIRSPTHRLLLDVYLHRSLAMSSAPSVGAYVSIPAPGADSTPRWYERLPGTPELRVLGRALDAAESDAWPRHGDLTRFLFERLGWGPAAFIGYRCDVHYPVWGATYMVSFEFGDAADAVVDQPLRRPGRT